MAGNVIVTTVVSSKLWLARSVLRAARRPPDGEVPHGGESPGTIIPIA